ncbi:unnamed protein product [Alopecurus aequalis]
MDGSDGAGEVSGAFLAALVEEEGEVNWDIELDTKDVGLDGGAEAEGGVKVGEPAEQWAALLAGRHAHLELEQIQHVGAHLQLQRVDRAAAGRWRRLGRRHNGRWDDRRGGGGAVCAPVGDSCEDNQVQGEEESQLRGRHGRDGQMDRLLG